MSDQQKFSAAILTAVNAFEHFGDAMRRFAAAANTHFDAISIRHIKRTREAERRYFEQFSGLEEQE